MPLYEYSCSKHGVFEQFRKASQYLHDGTCPVCQADSPRVLSLPRVRSMSPVQMNAGERNEKSRHEPHVCRAGCCHQHKPKSAQKTRGGLHAYSGPRPWVVEHAV